MTEPILLSLDVESLDLEGQGIAHHEGKVVFIEGALPGERVLARVTRRKPSFDKAKVERVLRASSQRTRPPCPHFGVCGGCAMQHLEPAAQLAGTGPARPLQQHGRGLRGQPFCNQEAMQPPHRSRLAGHPTGRHAQILQAGNQPSPQPN